eukprot:4157182-Prymnesium_polylepis.1
MAVRSQRNHGAAAASNMRQSSFRPTPATVRALPCSCACNALIRLTPVGMIFQIACVPPSPRVSPLSPSPPSSSRSDRRVFTAAVGSRSRTSVARARCSRATRRECVTTASSVSDGRSLCVPSGSTLPSGAAALLRLCSQDVVSAITRSSASCRRKRTLSKRPSAKAVAPYGAPGAARKSRRVPSCRTREAEDETDASTAPVAAADTSGMCAPASGTRGSSPCAAAGALAKVVLGRPCRARSACVAASPSARRGGVPWPTG